MKKEISGTYEWATATVNCTIGCPNDCKYCYAKRIAILQKRISTYAEWPRKNEEHRDLAKEKKKYDGTVMFPSTHDIFPGNLDICIDTIANLLEAGNHILITTKPRLECIEKLCETFEQYKDKILFRFTIGTSNESLLKEWEPGAPTFKERFTCLTYAYTKGFQTSVSMEPMLDSMTVVADARYMIPFITDGLWIGKMNKIDDRVRGISSKMIERIKVGQTDIEIHRIYTALKREEKVRWKESFKKVIGLELATTPGEDK